MGEDGYFGETVARRYDEDEREMFAREAVQPAVDFLAAFAGGGVLEFGIGTGRIGLPLAARGIPVSGIDLSHAMVERLCLKPGGDAIHVVIGDFATTRIEGQFSLVYLVFNTIMNLMTQQAQVACFRNAAAHLAPGGRFVIETMVPELRRLAPGETVLVRERTDSFEAVDEYDPATQALISHYAELVDGVWERSSIPFRYVWPAELDLMADLAGLRLLERWDDWDRSPFTAESTKHISVWEKPA